MKKVSIKIGDVFSAKLDNRSKKYFQYIANDLTQLNSDVIRVFKIAYALDANPDISEVINDEVSFYAHCVVKLGTKMSLWERVGNSPKIGTTSDILFKESQDYGHKVDEEPVKVSKEWYVWNINDSDFKKVGELKGENIRANIGLIFNPHGIIELLKGNKYPVNYPA